MAKVFRKVEGYIPTDPPYWVARKGRTLSHLITHVRKEAVHHEMDVLRSACGSREYFRKEVTPLESRPETGWCYNCTISVSNK